MDIAVLADGPSAAIVIGGTALATLLRSGLDETRSAIRHCARLARRGFDAGRIKAELARQLRDIASDGLLRADAHNFDDREFDDATRAMLEARSVEALVARHEHHSARRVAAGHAASATFAQAAELAPVFGLAGTLVSLSRLPEAGLAAGQFAGAISMAVLTTLYGLLLANLLLAPLARMIERRLAREEAERQELVDWMVSQVSAQVPRHPPEVRGLHRTRAA